MNSQPRSEDTSSGFHRRLGFGESPAVIVVDMCKAYFTDGSPLDLGDRSSVHACKTLVETARSQGVPVIWTRVEFQPGGADGGVFYRKVGALQVFDRGGELGEWLDDLAPVDGETVFTKQYASSFFGTELATHLHTAGIDTVIIGGVSTSGCVRATAVDACQHGFVPVVVREACGDRRLEVHESSLADLDAKYADVESLPAVVVALTRP